MTSYATTNWKFNKLRWNIRKSFGELQTSIITIHLCYSSNESRKISVTTQLGMKKEISV